MRQTVDARIAGWIAELAGARRVRRLERIQSLWSGYGELVRAHLEGGDRSTVVAKWVNPPRTTARGDVGDARKRRSYEVEAAFYRSYAARCSASCRVPRMVGAGTAAGERLLVLEDLDAAGYAERRGRARGADIDACLAWLAAFHATFLGEAPQGLWKVGTYWHLATRPDELAAIDDAALRSAAPVLDARLSACAFATFVHGDAKLANFCFGRGGREVAAVDFQYVGGGCGMKDVAYLLCGDVDSDATERRHLDAYFRLLREALTARANTETGMLAVDADALEAEWRALYPVACADFYRFLAGWSKRAWDSDARGQRLVREVLRAL